MVVTEADLLRDGFCESPKFQRCWREWDGQPAGYALFFAYYSSFEGRPGLFLEDIYVRDQYRGKGIGKALLAQVASVARQENCFGVRWQVLDWNTPAIEFYKSLGARFLDEWKTVSLDGDALEHVAVSAMMEQRNYGDDGFSARNRRRPRRIGSGMAVRAPWRCGRTLGDAAGALDSGPSDCGLRGTGVLQLTEVRQPRTPRPGC